MLFKKNMWRTDVFKKIFMLYSIAVTIAVIGFFAGKSTTEHRLMEQHRLELNAARERAAVLADTLEDIRTEAGSIGASLDRQRTSVSELRALIAEIRTRYEKMEELLDSSWDNYSDAWNIDSCIDISNGEQVE